MVEVSAFRECRFMSATHVIGYTTYPYFHLPNEYAQPRLRQNAATAKSSVESMLLWELFTESAVPGRRLIFESLEHCIRTRSQPLKVVDCPLDQVNGFFFQD